MTPATLDKLRALAEELRFGNPCTDASMFNGSTCIERIHKATRAHHISRWTSDRMCSACRIYWHVEVAGIEAAEGAPS